MRVQSMVGALLSVCASNVISADIPEQFHIALAGTDAFRVAWKTNNSTASVCSYGTVPSALNATVTGSSAQYLPGYGYHHVAKLTFLQPDTTYYYKCGDGASNMGPVFSFQSAPPAGAATNFSAVIFGDMGWLDSVTRGPMLPIGGLQSNWSATLTRELMESLLVSKRADLVWLVGDIAYADDSFGHLNESLGFGYENAYDGYMNWIQNVSSTLPFHVSPGNHESECHSPYCILNLEKVGLHLNNFTAYNARWHMPSQESGGVLNMWYSWTYGGVHFVSIDTSTDFPGAPEGETGDSGFSFLPAGHFAPNGTYMNWLAADLATAAADPSVLWIIGGGHRPFQDFNSQAVGDLFAQYNVAMYFAGHGHSYARYDTTAWNNVTTFVMVGGAGCDEMPFPSDQMMFLDSEGATGAVPMPVPSVDEEAASGNATLKCLAWCNDPVVRSRFFEEGKPSAIDGQDPCRYCNDNPVYVSDNMAIGVLQVTPKTLQWQLLRAPDGYVLDTVTLTR